MNYSLDFIPSNNLQTPNVSRGKNFTNNDINNILTNYEMEFRTCHKSTNLSNFNTGFDGNNDLHYETSCNSHKLKTPLYQENYFREFKTEEEKAAARHALGLYNNTDVVLMSLLTTEDYIPSQTEWAKAPIKQMQKGYEFFLPLTSFNAVYDSSGTTLDFRIKELLEQIQNSKKELDKITQVTTEPTITSLGDVKLFLAGFNNKENLRTTIDNIDQQMLRFEKIGEI